MQTLMGWHQNSNGLPVDVNGNQLIIENNPQTKGKGHSTSTPAQPVQNVMSSETDMDAKMREVNDMNRPTRHVPQILFNLFN